MLVTFVTLTAALAFVAVEVVCWRASRRRGSYGSPDPDARTEGLIVLGYGSRRRGRVHPLQRWRCEIAVRSRDAERSSIVVFSGGVVGRSIAESEAMAAFACDSLGLPRQDILTETRSRSTWENIAFALPMVSTAGVIKIVSDPLHAARARSYARQLRPDLAARLSPAEDYRPLERWWIKAACAGYALLGPIRKAIHPRARTQAPGEPVGEAGPAEQPRRPPDRLDPRTPFDPHI